MDLPARMLCSLQTPSHRFFYRSAREKQITTSILSYTQNSSPYSTDFIWTTYREVQWSRSGGPEQLMLQYRFHINQKCSDQECGGPEQLTLQYRFHINYVQRSAVIKSVGVLTVTPAASGVTRGTARLGLRPTNHIWLYGKWLNAEFPSFMRQIRVTERTPEATQISCTQLWSKTIGLFSYDN